jgi:Ca-activated chloride channel family protein
MITSNQTDCRAMVTITGHLLLVMAALLTCAQLQATDRIRLDEVRQGSLVFGVAGTNTYNKAPTLDTRVEMNITGMLARVTVTQTFLNSSDEWLHGIYIFPLPELAAVDELNMKIGERIIEGQIKEKQAAKKIYQQAKSTGKKASLVEQERPNIFTNSVANIGPGEKVVVEIGYQQTLTYDQGTFSIRFPMVVAPRYIPGNRVVKGFEGSGWAMNTDVVEDAQRITPIVETSPGRLADKRNNHVSLTISLHSGFPLATLESPYHDITQRTLPDHHYLIKLKKDVVPANRDFELRWTPILNSSPQAAFFTQAAGSGSLEEKYGLLMVIPPHEEMDQSGVFSRELVFVIDTSGSMHGASLAQAKSALDSALNRLSPRDQFNIVQFNSTTYSLAPDAIDASPENIRRARSYLHSLVANGGTEIREALEHVLIKRNSKYGDAESGNTGSRLRQIIFITDGSVGNENSLLDMIAKNLGNSRLFTIGIGSAPNSYFMREAARSGHGTFTYIGDINEVQDRMTGLFQKLESPVLSNIKIYWSQGQFGHLSKDSIADYWPNPLRDLYLGEPLIVSMKIPQHPTQLHVRGMRSDEPWSMSFPIETSGTARGLDRLWARYKIRSLTSKRHKPATSTDANESMRTQITQLALKHHLVSQYTSLVAVEVKPSRPAQTPSKDAAMNVRLPYAWNHQKVFGNLPRTATPAQLNLILGFILLLLSGWVLVMRRLMC